MAPTQLSSHFPAKRKERADSPLNPNNKKVQKAHTSDESDESVQRPASLTVDAWLEAKDEEELWYPAHVKQAAGRDVLIGFDGWDERWDEWIPKASPRLREHRGWGTPTMPKDWQLDSTIEALDMEGKWYRAKILHVAEHACRVPYNGWANKWDEWLRKDSGRLRRIGDKKTKPTDGKRNESHEDVCALCEEPGDLIGCDGRCQRSFHRSCIPPNNPPPSVFDSSTRWVCSDCRVKRFRWYAPNSSTRTHTCISFAHDPCDFSFAHFCANLSPLSLLSAQQLLLQAVGRRALRGTPLRKEELRQGVSRRVPPRVSDAICQRDAAAIATVLPGGEDFFCDDDD